MDKEQQSSMQESPKDDVYTCLEQLQKEKDDLERDFGLKRAKFKELFIQKEAELKREKESVLVAEKSVKEMEEQMSNMRDDMSRISSELEGVKTAAAVSENNKQQEINTAINNYQQEVASLQQLLKEASDTASDNTAAQYESERNKLVTLNENYEEEIQDLRTKLSLEREGFLSTVAKSIKWVGTVGSSSTSTNSEHENLEESMKKAQEDAQILKSVVVPLESEIKALKAKLEESELKLAEAEGRLQMSHEGTPPVTKTGSRSSPSLPDLDAISDPKEKVEKLYQYLKAEKAARTDLEMYVAVLSTQKTVLQDDADKVRNEMSEVCHLLEEEKQGHDSLKQTWQMANDQFLESQRLLMMDLRRMEGVLSTEQQRQIADLRKEFNNPPKVIEEHSHTNHIHESKHPKSVSPSSSSSPSVHHSHGSGKRRKKKLQQKDEEREAQKRKVADLEEKREKQEREHEERRKLSQSRMEQRSRNSSQTDPSSMSSTPRSNTDVTDSSRVPGARGGHAGNGGSEDGRRTGDDDDTLFVDSGVHDTRSLGGDSEGRDSASPLTVKVSPDRIVNLPALTAAQVKAITDPTPETEAHKSMMANVRSKGGASVNLEGKRMVSEREWVLLQEEMKASREKLGRPCSMCSNYETQLQSVQAELKSSQTENKHLEKSLSSEEQTNKNLLKYQSELEEALKNAAEDAQSQITHLSNKVNEHEKLVQDLKQQMTSTHLQLEDQCKSLSENREAVQRELVKLEEENDSLVDKYSKTAQQLQNEDINLPNNLEEMQLLLLKYREEIISAKVAKEHTDETLRSQMAFLKSQVVGEQQEKATLEETLSQEISTLQSKLSELESIKKDLEQESSNRAEAESKLRESESSLKSFQTKYKQVISKLQERLEEEDKRRSKLESDHHHLRGKVQSLQVDLDNSEVVQRDFVKLSQSLQIQLEKIRQAETEVRWQHEDDIDDCSNCKQPFSVTKRKHHCRHCGRIFCADCTTKAVNTGPNFRPAKVCDVCHTILVKDATPYFSTEPPATPD